MHSGKKGSQITLRDLTIGRMELTFIEKPKVAREADIVQEKEER